MPPGAAKEHAAPAVRTRQLGNGPGEHESLGVRRVGQATVHPVAPPRKGIQTDAPEASFQHRTLVLRDGGRRRRRRR
eukprot:12646093-Alexandrium_andersonii.AAC.1